MEGFFHLGNKEAREKAIKIYQKQSCLDKNRNNQMKNNLIFFFFLGLWEPSVKYFVF